MSPMRCALLYLIASRSSQKEAATRLRAMLVQL